MHRTMRILPALTLAACLLIPAGAIAFSFGEEPAESDRPAGRAAQAAGDAAPEAGEDQPEAAPESKPELSPELAALRDRIRRILMRNFRQPFNTRDNTPADVIQLCRAFGGHAEVHQGGSSGSKINAVGCLCWNYSCAGYRLLKSSKGRVMARIGYGLQRHPSQFLAVLALSRVPVDYEVRVGEDRGTVADLVEHQMLDCRSGSDLTFKLIGLAHYLETDRRWKNHRGEDWSVDRLVVEELARSADVGNSDVTNRLMGLSYAVDRRIQRQLPVDGPFLRAQSHVSKYHDHALKLQNPDGSWHPRFFAATGTSRDLSGLLRSTGHILEWLAFSLPEDRLKDPRVLRSVDYLAALLENRRFQQNVNAMSARDIAAVMHAAHALLIYDHRAFKPWDPEEPAQEGAQSEQQPTSS